MNEIKNRVQLMGNLGGDPELKTFTSGKTKATFSMATNERYKNQDGDWITTTQWHTIIGWDNIAKRMEKILKKGSEVIIFGKLMYRQYEDTSGSKKTITEINADNFEIISKKQEA
ncbi:MAG: single-stranded DNA-binding protein [Cyclobacteriaceae bacterium]|nr:single-stranded DNA-binding protein [Cyclobacteriaceae bacterium]